MHSTNLNLLAALDALLQEGSVAGAAARLGLTAPAVSRALARLRAATGDPLLVRAGRGLVPTPHARALRERVRAAAAEARALLAPAAAADPRAASRVFVLRADDAVAAVLGPPLLAALRDEAPGITVIFRAEEEEGVDALRDGRVDLDVGVQGALGPEVRTRRLLEDERVVLRRAIRGRRARPLSLAQLAAAEHVDVSRRGRTRGPLDELLARHGLSRRVRAVVPNQLAAAALVAGTEAVSLVSRRFAMAIRGVLPVDFSPAPAPLGREVVAAAWHPRLDADTAHAWLREEIYRIARRLAAEG
jgi:DNA-binding transcriptional LysR family regulator